MDKIQVRVLNPSQITDAARMQAFAARLTQRGEKLTNIDDVTSLWQKSYTNELTENLTKLPHNTIRQFNMLNVVVAGASRRFLAQITRRRVGVTFTSASLQYSDYSGHATARDFVVPYELIATGKSGAVAEYLHTCKTAMQAYEECIRNGLSGDTAGYLAPQSLRNILLISATPQAWIEMIRQRICRRNTDETRYVMLKIWTELWAHSDTLFGENCYPDCCSEGNMSCGKSMKTGICWPPNFIREDFPFLDRKETYG